MTRRARFWTLTRITFAVFLIVLSVVSVEVLSSQRFANYIRAKIISTTEESTGGKVEIGAFQFDWRHLRATADNFVLHGTEPPGSPPLFEAHTIELRLKLLAGLKQAVDLDYLGIDRPTANVIVFPDGRTNIPAHKVVTKSDKTTLETVVDLAIHRFEVFNGSAAFAQQSIGFSGRGENLNIQMFYRAAPAGYQGDLKIGSLQLTPRGGQPLNASLDLPIEIGSDNIDLKNATLATRDSQIRATVALSHLAEPVITAQLIAHVSLTEVQRTAGLALDACSRNTPCYADANVEARLDQQNAQISKASLRVGQTDLEASGTKSNVQFRGRLALDEMGRLFRIQAEPRGEIILTGSAQNPGTEGYTVSGNILGRRVGMGHGPKGIENIMLSSDVAASGHMVELHKLSVGAFGGEIDGDATLVEYSRFKLDGQLRSLKLLDLERQIAPAGTGYDGTVSGSIEASGDLKLPAATGIRAQAQLSIAPGSKGVPISGKVQAAYDGARNTVELGQSYFTLPRSRLDLSGVLGSRIAVSFASTGLDDLYPALAMSSKAPPKEIPVALKGGTLALRAEVTGPLDSPRIAAHIEADRFSVEQRPFDHFNADVSAFSSGAAVANGALTHQNLQAQFSGSIGLTQWSAGNDAPVMLALNMRNGDIADLLALVGDSNIPGRGSGDISAQLSGTLGNPLGTAHLAAVNGAVYDQPFDKMDLNVDFADQTIRLDSLDVTAQSAHLQGSGTYTHPRDSLLTGRVQLQLVETGLHLGQLVALDKQHPGMDGSVQLTASVLGDIRKPSGETEFSLSNIHGDLQAHGLRDKQRNYGDLTAHAETAGSIVSFNLDSDLAGAAIKVVGRTTLTADFPTTADASIQNLHIENAIALAGESFPAKGVVGLMGRVSGTIKEPSADMQLSLTAAKVYDEPIDNLQATLRYSSRLIEIPSLRLVTPAGSLTVNGSFSHPSNQLDSGKIELHAESDDLRLAQIRNLQEKKPGIGGTLRLMTDFAGDLKTSQGGRDISLSKANASLKASGIAYNGHTYGNASLIAENKGTAVAFKADSDFAGAAIHGEGDAKLEGDYPVTAKFTLANIRYSNLRGWLGDASVQPGFEALFEAQASVSGPAKKPDEMKGNLQVTRLELTTAPPGAASAGASIALKNDGVVAVDYDHGSMRIQSAHLTGKSTDIAITGTAALTGANPLNLTIKASSNLGLLQDIERDIHASGAVAIDAVVRGNFSQPLANGTVQLKDASINLESLPNGISKANGVIVLNGSGATIRNLSAESGGGKLTLAGFAVLTGPTIRYSLNAKMDRVRTRFEGISVVNSGALTLGGTSDRSVISGTVTVERVVYNPQSDIGSMLTQLTHGAGPNVSGNVSGVAAAMRLDVHIRTSPAVRFETTMAQALQADADLSVVGTVAQPGVVGRVNITQGDLIFFGNQYKVNRGLIAFYDPATIDPRINIDLETTVKSITVTLGISGPMNNLKLSYRSDPPFQFDEIVALLTTGRRPSSDPNIVATQAAAPQQSVSEMGETAIVSQAVASPLSSRLQRVFGVNQLSVDPTFAAGSALPQARLSLQQQVANTVTFTYTQDLSQSNSELVRVEWAVNPRFSAVATRDENGIFGVDFFYKRQFR